MQVNKTALLFLLLLPLHVFADGNQANGNSQAEDLPDADLLEFIAEFEPLDGQWVDPIQLNMIFADNRKGKDNEQSHN
jgi:hypothetical protein